VTDPDELPEIVAAERVRLSEAIKDLDEFRLESRAEHATHRNALNGLRQALQDLAAELAEERLARSKAEGRRAERKIEALRQDHEKELSSLREHYERVKVRALTKTGLGIAVASAFISNAIRFL
jgi:chromosome segregation ATPase